MAAVEREVKDNGKISNPKLKQMQDMKGDSVRRRNYEIQENLDAYEEVDISWKVSRNANKNNKREILNMDWFQSRRKWQSYIIKDTDRVTTEYIEERSFYILSSNPADQLNVSSIGDE